MYLEPMTITRREPASAYKNLNLIISVTTALTSWAQDAWILLALEYQVDLLTACGMVLSLLLYEYVATLNTIADI